MAQVKFYATTAESYAAIESKDNGGIYFVQGGELYKGANRFGLGRVTVAESTASIEGAARGDIVVTGSGAGWVYDGTNWQSIGGDIASLQSMWRADISASLSGLVAGGTGSYITGITQNADGSVTANASTFETDVKTAVGGGSASGTGNGITVSVTTTSGVVTSVEVEAANISATSVSAASGTFTNLNVTNTATFSATTVSADTLTIGGSTVEQLADKQIASIPATTSQSTSAGITVGVTTQSGSVTAVTVDAGTFGNVMHFVGAGTELPASATSGDVYVFTGNATDESGYKAGQEVVYTGSVWEVIGDQNTYAVNAYTSAADVYNGVATVHGALDAVGAQVDALTDKTDAYVGGTSTSADQGVSVTVAVDASTMAPTVTTTVTSATLFGGLDADVSSSENNSIQVGVTQVDGVVTGVTADLVWLGADGNALA